LKEVGAYYVVVEALNNAAKHARASVVEVCAQATGTDLHLEIRDDGIGSEDGLPVRVDVVEDLGADAFVYGTGVIGGTSRNITIRASGRNHPKKGEMMYITTDPRNLHVFDTATGSRLSD
jgi:anti-sigma regulatory factor (Ser/Thr protein kinase)